MLIVYANTYGSSLINVDQHLVGERTFGFFTNDKVGTIGVITNFVFQYIWSFLHYLHNMTLVNVKLNVSGYNRIIFQNCNLHWSHSFLMVRQKWSCHYWHSCIAESLWKTLFVLKNRIQLKPYVGFRLPIVLDLYQKTLSFPYQSASRLYLLRTLYFVPCMGYL